MKIDYSYFVTIREFDAKLILTFVSFRFFFFKTFDISNLYTIMLSCSRGRDRMIVGFITTCAINVYHH